MADLSASYVGSYPQEPSGRSDGGRSVDTVHPRVARLRGGRRITRGFNHHEMRRGRRTTPGGRNGDPPRVTWPACSARSHRPWTRPPGMTWPPSRPTLACSGSDLISSRFQTPRVPVCGYARGVRIRFGDGADTHAGHGPTGDQGPQLAWRSGYRTHDGQRSRLAGSLSRHAAYAGRINPVRTSVTVKYGRLVA
jgi:hypothetical protein